MKKLHITALAGLLWAAGLLLGQETTPAKSTNAPALDQEARELKPLDTLRYNVIEDPPGRGQFPSVQITELGDAQFPISATSQEYIVIKAAGRKLADLRKELKLKLDADFYQNATVNLELLRTRESQDQPKSGPVNVGKVIVHGSINATVQLWEDKKLTLSEVFAQLAAQSQYANLKKVELLRPNPATKQTQSIIKDVKKMLDGDLTDDIELKDGDRIKVVDKKVIF